VTKCFLCIGGDTLEDAEAHDSIADAVNSYRLYTEDVLRFDDTCHDASIHIPDNDKVSVAARPDPRDRLGEYPDYVLSIGPRGGVRKERT